MRIFSTLTFFLFFAGSFFQSVIAQQGQCGINFEDEYELRERMFEQRRTAAQTLERYQHFRNNDHFKVFIPIQFHLLATDDGIGRVRIDKLLQNLCYTNELYQNLVGDLDNDGQVDDTLSVTFYLNGDFNYIDNSIFYQHTDGSLVSYLMSIYKAPDALNIFIGNTIPSSGFGTTLAYYSSLTDAIYSIRNTINGQSATLAHEIGHLLTLAHPHFGWDGIDFANDPTYLATGCAPVQTPNGLLCEKVARFGGNENCQVAADGFCDTRPDYNFGIYSGGCVNTVGAKDPDCDTVLTTSVDNIMSYFSDSCTSVFTPEQTRAMYLDILSRGLHFNTPPSSLPVQETPTLTYPINNQYAFYPNAVNLRWNGVIGASRYLVTVYEYVIGIQGNLVTQFTTSENSVFLYLPANKSFGWRIKPLGITDVCNSYETDFEFFRTKDWLLGQENIEMRNDFNIFPNPTTHSDLVTLEIYQSLPTEPFITIHNALGQMMLPRQQQRLHAGHNLVQLDLSSLQPGIYWVRISDGSSQMTKKLIIKE